MIQFFSVSLPENLRTLEASIPRLSSQHPGSLFTVIVPDHSVQEFKSLEAISPQVSIVPESTILSLSDFRLLLENESKECDFRDEFLVKCNWYYQQMLKLAFGIHKASLGVNTVMWDADTIPIGKIEFFSNGRSLLYGSLEEYHPPYFQTISVLFRELPKSFFAYTVQFFSLTKEESIVLYRRIAGEKEVPCLILLAPIISERIVRAIIKAHRTNGYLISEQEIVGLSNQLLHSSKQKPIKYLRWGIQGWLSESQIQIAKLARFRHITYENPKRQWSKQLSWLRLFYVLLKYSFKQSIYMRCRLLMQERWNPGGNRFCPAAPEKQHVSEDK